MMKQTIQRLSNFFSVIFASGASLSMFLLFLIILVNSLRRYAFGKSLEWGEELPVFMAIYGVMFGSAWAYIQDRHIRFTILTTFLSRTQKRWLLLLVDLSVAITGSILTYSGWLFVVRRGGLETSGLINLAKQLKGLTGWDNLIWIGHFYPYQAAIMIGGFMLTISALLKFSLRLTGEETEAPIGG